jgi:hypothetical protein
MNGRNQSGTIAGRLRTSTGKFGTIKTSLRSALNVASDTQGKSTLLGASQLGAEIGRCRSRRASPEGAVRSISRSRKLAESFLPLSCLRPIHVLMDALD